MKIGTIMTFQGSYPDTFAPRLVWVSATFLLCGGGTMQIAAMVHLLASKFAGVEHTYVRKCRVFDSFADPFQW